MSYQRLIGKYIILFYNISQFTGWTLLLVGVFHKILEGEYNISNDPSIFELIKIVQGFQCFDVVSAIVQYGKSKLLSTLANVTIKNIVVWFIFPYTIDSNFPIFVIVCWCLDDMIRFGTYINQAMKLGFNFLKIIGHNAFLILYPVGIIGEFLSGGDAQDFLESENRNHKLRFFNITLPIDALVFVQIFRIVAIPGLGFRFRRMWRLRRRYYQLKRDNEKEKEKKLKQKKSE